jgi:hypothetical protein
MARSNYKYVYVSDNDLKYLYSKINQNYDFETDSYRNKTINMLNYTNRYSIHQGDINVFLKPNIFHLNYKLGMFSKTKKPFFFRPKKKNKK